MRLFMIRPHLGASSVQLSSGPKLHLHIHLIQAVNITCMLFLTFKLSTIRAKQPNPALFGQSNQA